ncbi:Iron-sulfur cluster regulator IscR [Dissulfuribacter thermophilus]|uniref:Iron-sulfur cluster regulator IscR n=1 Tax=Dissulfuribacter thermophilus TaxID=1156395 RepID=A0A1B9F7Q4_9BACT|nr:Rrf2 family transcriptional regulator [Dissulfuribacter thermophilus]OCC15835.1 Iron-sulfur cluster regulator IscR [Dissulfuribacter thermophilus]
MKLTTRTRYGTRLMVELAKNYEKGPLQLNEIAKRQDLPLKYLEQIVMPLREAGLIKSVRGVKGGHMLARPPEDISVFDILKVTEGDALTPCTEDDPNCDRFPHCETKDVWIKINKIISEELKKISLNKLIEKGS